MLGDDELRALANDSVNALNDAELRLEALEERWALVERGLARVQEEFLAEGVAKGYDGTKTALYALIVSLRIAAIS